MTGGEEVNKRGKESVLRNYLSSVNERLFELCLEVVCVPFSLIMVRD